MQFLIEIRRQHSVGKSNGGFGGPDTYVAVQVVPDRQTPLKSLNHVVAAKRGIKIIYVGEGYSEHREPRSMLGRAWALDMPRGLWYTSGKYKVY